MQEQINDRVSVGKRNQELFDIVDKCSVGALQEYIARLVENAYLAGIHQVTCNREPKYEDNLGIGPHLVRARSYVKDKGLIP